MLGYAGNNEAIVRKLSDDFHIPVVAMTLGEEKTVRTGILTGLVCSDGRLYTDDVTEIETVDRFGVGDAFTAGFIYGYLTGGIERGLKIGDAMAALMADGRIRARPLITHTFPWVLGLQGARRDAARGGRQHRAHGGDQQFEQGKRLHGVCKSGLWADGWGGTYLEASNLYLLFCCACFLLLDNYFDTTFSDKRYCLINTSSSEFFPEEVIEKYYSLYFYLRRELD